MPDAPMQPDSGTEAGGVSDTPKAPVPVRRRGMFDDPVVRRMAFVALGLVILFLSTVAGALVTGLLAPSSPRTLAEKEIAVAGQAVREGNTDPAVWGDYISALVGGGQYGRARSVIEDARRSIDDSGTAEIPLGEARLHAAQGEFEQAVESADEVLVVLEADLQTRLASGGLIADRAKISGHHDNYYVAILIKANAYRDLGQWEDAIEQYGIYIERNPGAADILIDRGNAKVEIDDTSGAEEDFRQALLFIPDSPEALEGLERIGVTP